MPIRVDPDIESAKDELEEPLCPISKLHMIIHVVDSHDLICALKTVGVVFLRTDTTDQGFVKVQDQQGLDLELLWESLQVAKSAVISQNYNSDCLLNCDAALWKILMLLLFFLSSGWIELTPFEDSWTDCPPVKGISSWILKCSLFNDSNMSFSRIRW